MPGDDVVEACKPIAAENGCTILLTDDPKEACTNADVIYTDVWVSMGEPDEVWAERIKELEPYRTIGVQKAEQFGITEMEVTDEVFESKQSKVFDEAENRMHTIKAVMYATLK